MTNSRDMSQPMYSPPPVMPRAVRPPLTRRARRGAAIAGSIGFLLLTIGCAMVAIPIALVIVVAFIALIVRAASTSAATSSAASPNLGVEQFFSGFDFTPWIVPLIVIAMVGVILMVGAIVASGRILVAHQVRRPWGVTWAGSGIAIVSSWFITGIVGSVSSAVSGAALSPFTPRDSFGAGGIWGSGLVWFLVVSAVLGLALTAATGWLSWWWMAHAMRPAAPPALANPASANPAWKNSESANPGARD